MPSNSFSEKAAGGVALEDDGDDCPLGSSSSNKFLEALAPAKRHTVLTIVSSIAEESVIAFRTMSDDTDTEAENDIDGGVANRVAEDPTVDRKATEIGYEFAKKTGKIDGRPSW
ncbi:hypothetical protein NMY22_g19830 [Coprinellus aureogranulatus]|nr:hypothetical protein NMY22_g19830 [Coprinellus aureogranulatus]